MAVVINFSVDDTGVMTYTVNGHHKVDPSSSLNCTLIFSLTNGMKRGETSVILYESKYFSWESEGGVENFLWKDKHLPTELLFI